VFAIVGLGAVGSLLAYFLNSAGMRPYAVVRTGCERRVFCGEACRELDVEAVPRAPPSVKYTLIAVKGPDTQSALEAAAGTPVLFQNGIGGLETARERFPNALGAVVTYGVYREGCRAELRGVGEIALPRGAEEVAEALERGGARGKGGGGAAALGQAGGKRRDKPSHGHPASPQRRRGGGPLGLGARREACPRGG